MPVSVSPDERLAALRAFEPHLGTEATETLGQLLPRRPWKEAVPPEFWVQRHIVEAQRPDRRRRLHAALAETLGADHAAVFMELLPPVAPSLLPRGGHELDPPVYDS